MKTRTDRMSVDLDRGRDAVAAALAAVDAVGPGTHPPTSGTPPEASFGRGLGARGAAVVALLSGAQDTRARHLRRIRAGLEDARQSVQRISGADHRAAGAVADAGKPTGDGDHR
ncbi:hypothetical protein [Corynebacterium variabile]|uniref:hypothetical protein n=1 Tax=Corynebacterium variabile TaxID=1727 RepID=UPI00289E1A61|nr:hypothetical protein [Corynebacterium variabile]